MYLEGACGLACLPNLWRYRLPSFSSTSGFYPPGPMVPTWVTASRFFVGNREAEPNLTTFSSLLLFHVFLSFLFSRSPSDIVPLSAACWGYTILIISGTLDFRSSPCYFLIVLFLFSIFVLHLSAWEGVFCPMVHLPVCLGSFFLLSSLLSFPSSLLSWRWCVPTPLWCE